MEGLCLLGLDEDTAPAAHRRGHTVAATLGGGVALALLVKQHPVLGLLNGMAIGSNVSRVLTKEINTRRAIENLGAHAVATVASLSLPRYPALGYIGGAAGANLFIRDRGDSYLERLDEIVLGASSATLDDVRAGKGTIKKGDKGDAVRYVQAIVGVPIDGDFGPATFTAVRAWQKNNGLAVDGVVGKLTLAGMDRAASSTGGFSSVDFTHDGDDDAPGNKSNSTASADVPRAGRAAPKSPAGSAPAAASGPGTALVPSGNKDSGGGMQLYSRAADGSLQILNRPAWQMALAGVGLVALGSGAYMLASGR